MIVWGLPVVRYITQRYKIWPQDVFIYRSTHPYLAGRKHCRGVEVIRGPLSETIRAGGPDTLPIEVVAWRHGNETGMAVTARPSILAMVIEQNQIQAPRMKISSKSRKAD